MSTNQPIQSYVTTFLYISVTTPFLPTSADESSSTGFVIGLAVISAITFIVIVALILTVVFVIISKKQKSNSYNLRSR